MRLAFARRVGQGVPPRLGWNAPWPIWPTRGRSSGIRLRKRGRTPAGRIRACGGYSFSGASALVAASRETRSVQRRRRTAGSSASLPAGVRPSASGGSTKRPRSSSCEGSGRFGSPRGSSRCGCLSGGRARRRGSYRKLLRAALSLARDGAAGRVLGCPATSLETVAAATMALTGRDRMGTRRAVARSGRRRSSGAAPARPLAVAAPAAPCRCEGHRGASGSRQRPSVRGSA